MAFVLVSVSSVFTVAEAASGAKLNKTSACVVKGKTVQLKVNGRIRKGKWKTSDTSIATVTKKGLVKTKDYGVATISIKVGKKTLKCKVRVETAKQVRARKARNYILKKGKKSDWDGSGRTGYAIGYKEDNWLSDIEHDELFLVRVCAYKDTTEMYFQYFRDDYMGEFQEYIEIWIDPIKREYPGKVKYEYYDYDDVYEEYNLISELTAEIGFDYDGTESRLNIYDVKEYDKESGEYITATGEERESTIRTGVNALNLSMHYYDKVFKKAKLSNTMKNTCFSEFSE